MTVLEIMERANSRDTKLAIAWMKDAFNAIQSTQRAGGKARVKKMAITKGQREYNLPADCISIKSISSDSPPINISPTPDNRLNGYITLDSASLSFFIAISVCVIVT